MARKPRKPPQEATRAPVAAGEEQVVNVYNWSDYIDPAMLEKFTAETGIKVNYDVFDSNEVLETKLLAGNTGYDVVVPSASFMERQIKAACSASSIAASCPTGLTWIPRSQRVALHDPGNEHSVNHMWGTDGIGYNEGKIKAIMPNAPLDSWDMIFDPKVVSKWELRCLGARCADRADRRDARLPRQGPEQPEPGRPEGRGRQDDDDPAYIRMIHSSQYIDALANGEICLALGWSGDVLQPDRADEAGQGNVIKYSVPKEGTIIWFDMYAVPTDAPHPDNACLHQLHDEARGRRRELELRQLRDRQCASVALVNEDVRNDPGVYPPPEVKAKLFPDLSETDEYTRLPQPDVDPLHDRQVS